MTKGGIRKPSRYLALESGLPVENRFEGKIRIKMIGREPITIEER